MDRLIVDARQLSLVSERNNNAHAELTTIFPAFSQTDVRIVEREFPLAIEIQPLRPRKLWARIFGTRYLQLFSH